MNIKMLCILFLFCHMSVALSGDEGQEGVFFSHQLSRQILLEAMRPLCQRVIFRAPWDGLEPVSQDPLCMIRQEDLVQTVKGIFRAQGIPEEFVWIMMVESRGQFDAVSRSGAVGLFQLMPVTAMRYGLNVFWIDERYDVQKNAIAAARYLKKLYSLFRSWDLALAAYNGGEGRISRALRRNNQNSFWQIQFDIPSQTRNYVLKVKREIMEREGLDISALPAPQSASNAWLLWMLGLQSLII